ncbi:MAG: Asp23/Gls24 family envelope stress response protein [Pyramidobacter sp.]|jgi:uncharacterized alkaline shock family protein YloU
MSPMDKLDQSGIPVQTESNFDLDRAVAEAVEDNDVSPAERLHISADVIQEIASRALSRVSSVAPASAGSSVLGIGRKSADGVRVSIEEGDTPQISMDVYVQVKYGLRIPDVAWDLQEFLKNELEKSTGYAVKAVNIYVQGVFFQEGSDARAADLPAGENFKTAPQNDNAKAALTTAGE